MYIPVIHPAETTCSISMGWLPAHNQTFKCLLLRRSDCARAPKVCRNLNRNHWSSVKYKPAKIGVFCR